MCGTILRPQGMNIHDTKRNRGQLYHSEQIRKGIHGRVNAPVNMVEDKYGVRGKEEK